MHIDLNADVGEAFGPWTLAPDDALLAQVSSANVACGFHAGDPATMRRTVVLAARHGVAIGAHPGLPDLAGFGRRAMAITPEEAYDIVVYQVGALIGVARAQGATVSHVKPHGALYNMAAGDAALADAIARAVRDLDPSLVLFGLAGSASIAAGERHGLRTLAEGFPERGYAADGTLLPRSHPDAIVHDPAVVADRAVSMAREGRFATLCIHGDHPSAVAVASAVRGALERAFIRVAAPAHA